MQSGMYVDYIIKQFTEMFVRNVFIYSSIFFGEKFIIEFISKKTIDSLTTYCNTKFFNTQYEHTNLYHNMIVGSLIAVVALEGWFLFLV